MSKQPEWKFVANLGDASPIEYGGAFLYIDITGVYPPEIEMLFSPDEDPEDESKEAWEVRRFIIEPCTWINGILSDNKFHPDKPAWFFNDPARPQDGRAGLGDLASFIGSTPDEVAKMFTGDLYDRAQAWMLVGRYHGWENLDGYPIFFNKIAAEERYAEEIEELTRRARSGDRMKFSWCWAHHPRGGYVEGWASEEKDGERYIAQTVEDAVIGGLGMSFPASQVYPGDAPSK